MINRFLSVVVIVFSLPFVIFSANAQKSQSDKEVFDIVSAELDKGGSYYSIQNTKYLFSYIQEGMKSGRQALATLPQSRQLGGISPAMIADVIDAAAEGFGFGEIKAVGISSLLLNPEERNTLFHNKTFLYCGKKNPQGFLWTLIPAENKKLIDLQRLPANTISAFSIEMMPLEAWNELKKIFARQPVPQLKAIPLLAEIQVMNNYNVPLPDVLKSLSGKWFGVIVSAKAKDGKPVLFAMLEVPANDTTGFNLLKNVFISSFEAVATQDKITFKESMELPQWIKPEIFIKDKKLYLVSSPEILEMTQEAEEKGNGLVKSAEFQRFNQKMSDVGVGFMYRSSRTPDVITNMINAYIPADAINRLQIIMPLVKEVVADVQFSVAARTDNGLVVNSNAPTTIIAGAPERLAATATTGIFAGMLLPALMGAREKARRISCTSNLKQIGLALMEYGMDSEDQFPEEDNIAGINRLIQAGYLTKLECCACPSTKCPKAAGVLKEINSSYIYLGGFRLGPIADVPLAFDKPGNHDSYINVLFADGHVKGFPLKYTTCEEVILFLSRKNSYGAGLQRKLIEKARRIDWEMGYK